MKYFLMFDSGDGLEHHVDKNDETILFATEEEAWKEADSLKDVTLAEVHKCNEPEFHTYTEQ